MALCLVVILAGTTFVIVRGRLRSRDHLVHPTVGVSVHSTVQLGESRGSSCASPQKLRIHRQKRIGPKGGDEVHAPLCYHLVGWSGGIDECLVEYPVSEPGGLQPKSIMAGVAVMYYWVSQGGLAYFTADDRANAYIMLDPTWCSVLGASGGLAVVE